MLKMKTCGCPFHHLGAVYEKGGMGASHVASYIMGDSAFFDAARTFGGQPMPTQMQSPMILRASWWKQSTEVYLLTYFFDQWLYTPYRPVYSVTF